jgi:hypothetical protein
MPKHKNNNHDDGGDKGERGPGGKREREFEHDKGNAAHIEIEERRFRGGLPPTPERYARAREQWNRLPGALVRPGQGPVGGQPPDDANNQPSAGPKADDDNNREGS